MILGVGWQSELGLAKEEAASVGSRLALSEAALAETKDILLRTQVLPATLNTTTEREPIPREKGEG